MRTLRTGEPVLAIQARAPARADVALGAELSRLPVLARIALGSGRSGFARRADDRIWMLRLVSFMSMDFRRSRFLGKYESYSLIEFLHPTPG